MIENIFELIFRENNICFICDSKIEGLEDNICLDCKSKINFVGNYSCDKCGKKIDIEEGILAYCTDCQKVQKEFTKGISLYVYEGLGKEIIKKFKFQDKGYLKKVLGSLVAKKLEELGLKYLDIVIPVPMTVKKTNNRGYNQSELLGNIISKKLGIPIDKSIIIKTKGTGEQNKLKGEQRRKNLKNVFIVKDISKIENKKILLVDDVYTTGSTINEISKLLKNKGSGDIYFATVATSHEKKLYNY